MIQQLKHLFDIRLLYFLLPISLGSGPFFPDLIVVIFSIILIIQTIKKNIFYNLINPLSIFFTLFYCYLLIASYFSDNFIFSLESSLFYFRYILFFLAFSLFFNDTNKRFFSPKSSQTTSMLKFRRKILKNLLGCEIFLAFSTLVPL